VRRASLLVVFAWLSALPASAQSAAPCRVLCTPEFKIEPTITITNVFSRPRTAVDGETATRERRETEFEVIFSFGLPTRVSWLEFTAEAIVLPFDGDATPELELEANVIWLPSERTRGWVSSHFDVVDKFSPAARPADRRAYSHKLNLELDTSLAVFNWLPEGRWLRGVELEGSLDYVASGLPRRGDRVDGRTFLDKASPWSFSIVFVLPVAPF
jgi:hypothetical protein